MPQEPPEIVRALGAHAFASDGRRYLDLMNGFGAVFLGHGHPEVVQALQEQAARVWICGRHPTAAGKAANERIRELLPPGWKPGGLYSTGMEAAEFAMRLASTTTARTEFVGFARSMHGKSAMTAALCWANSPIPSDRVHMLPFVDRAPEQSVLDSLAKRLATRRIAAVWVEPIQGSNAAHEATPAFLRRVIELCREHGTLCVFDEILTGLYRTGPRFFMDGLDAKPDILLFAKCMANGFPVSSVAVPESMAIGARALPGSTFSGNPLAAAAVAATLGAMAQIEMASRVETIGRTVTSALSGLVDSGVTLRGRGALWVLELPERMAVEVVLGEIQRAGVMVSSYGRCIRLLPAATIDPAELRQACDSIARICATAYAAVDAMRT